MNQKKTLDAVAFMRKRHEELSRDYAGLSAEQIEERIEQSLKDDPLWKKRSHRQGPSATTRERTARVENITQAILAKAFRGELVPMEAELAHHEAQDCQPASALLARIRAARSATEPNNTRRRPHGPKGEHDG